jgi:hypothetical protein
LFLSVQYALKDAAMPARGELRRWVRATEPGAAK